MTYISDHKWECPKCLLTRLPEEDLVTENGQSFLLRVCRVCKYKDIEILPPTPTKHKPKKIGGFKYNPFDVNSHDD